MQNESKVIRWITWHIISYYTITSKDQTSSYCSNGNLNANNLSSLAEFSSSVSYLQFTDYDIGWNLQYCNFITVVLTVKVHYTEL
jgi:hypothetical protein